VRGLIMLHGLFLDPRIWAIDLQASPLWKPEKYGITFDLHPDAFKIPQLGISDKYQFVLTTEVWEIPMRKTLEYLRAKGLKVFLMPRETFITEEKKELMFSYPKFLYNGEYFLKPDAVMAPNKIYASYWKGKADVTETGYPRFDYLAVDNQINRTDIVRKYGLSPNRKILFFPSYPPYYHKTDGSFIDIYDGREQTLQMLEGFARANSEYQVVAKIHPMSFKCFKKGTGNKKEVSGTLLKYYKAPTDYMKVIGDVRMSGDIAKELLLAADMVVGFNSTMLLEALALNKPTLHMLLGNTADTKFIAYKDYMPTAYTEQEALDFINSPYTTDDKRLVDDYLCGADGKSCERICKIINKHCGVTK